MRLKIELFFSERCLEEGTWDHAYWHADKMRQRHAISSLVLHKWTCRFPEIRVPYRAFPTSWSRKDCSTMGSFQCWHKQHVWTRESFRLAPLSNPEKKSGAWLSQLSGEKLKTFDQSEIKLKLIWNYSLIYYWLWYFILKLLQIGSLA